MSEQDETYTFHQKGFQRLYWFGMSAFLVAILTVTAGIVAGRLQVLKAILALFVILVMLLLADRIIRRKYAQTVNLDLGKRQISLHMCKSGEIVEAELDHVKVLAKENHYVSFLLPGGRKVWYGWSPDLMKILQKIRK